MISTSVVDLDGAPMPQGVHTLAAVDVYRNGDPGDEDRGPSDVVMVYAHRASECSSCIHRAKVLAEREARRAKSGWQDIDGEIHIVGDCPSCEPRECRKCRLKLQHWQPVYGGIAYECEHCDAEDWEQGPAPAHDEIGFAL